MRIRTSTYLIPLLLTACDPPGAQVTEISACDQASLAATDHFACAEKWRAAKTEAERAEIRAHYAEVAKGNRLAKDGVPTQHGIPPDTR